MIIAGIEIYLLICGLARMIEIMKQMGEGEHGSPVARTRVEVLTAYL